MCNASWDWTFPEVERSYQIWQPFQKRQFARTDNGNNIIEARMKGQSLGGTRMKMGYGYVLPLRPCFHALLTDP